eukprot:1183403-Prorocentrum_minimum.AAC.1
MFSTRRRWLGAPTISPDLNPRSDPAHGEDPHLLHREAVEVAAAVAPPSGVGPRSLDLLGLCSLTPRLDPPPPKVVRLGPYPAGQAARAQTARGLLPWPVESARPRTRSCPPASEGRRHEDPPVRGKNPDGQHLIVSLGVAYGAEYIRVLLEDLGRIQLLSQASKVESSLVDQTLAEGLTAQHQSTIQANTPRCCRDRGDCDPRGKQKRPPHPGAPRGMLPTVTNMDTTPMASHEAVKRLYGLVGGRKRHEF